MSKRMNEKLLDGEGRGKEEERRQVVIRDIDVSNGCIGKGTWYNIASVCAI